MTFDDEIDDAPEVESAEPSNLRDEIRSALNDAKEKEALASEPPEKPEEIKTERSRDNNGRFSKAAQKTESAAPETETTKTEAPAEPTGALAAPQAWSATAKAKFAELPGNIQQEIVKRERDFEKGLRSQDEERMFGKQLKEVISPYMPIINAEGGNPIGAVRDLLNTAYLLRTSDPQTKGRLVWQIAQQYGADMTQNSPTASYVDPQLQQVYDELNQVKAHLQREQTLQQHQQRATIDAEIEAFSKDPAHTYFEDVKGHMAALLSSGLATDLQDAYEQAVYARPDIRSTILAQQRAEEEAKRAAEMKAKTLAARNKAVSITGAPGAAVPTAKAPERSLREELQANLRAAYQQ